MENQENQDSSAKKGSIFDRLKKKPQSNDLSQNGRPSRRNLTSDQQAGDLVSKKIKTITQQNEA